MNRGDWVVRGRGVLTAGGAAAPCQQKAERDGVPGATSGHSPPVSTPADVFGIAWNCELPPVVTGAVLAVVDAGPVLVPPPVSPPEGDGEGVGDGSGVGVGVGVGVGEDSAAAANVYEQSLNVMPVTCTVPAGTPDP